MKCTYTDTRQEFFIVDETISIGVKKEHESDSFLKRDIDLDLAEARIEFFSVDLLVAFLVKDLEGSCLTFEIFTTTFPNLSSNSLKNSHLMPLSKGEGFFLSLSQS